MIKRDCETLPCPQTYKVYKCECGMEPDVLETMEEGVGLEERYSR